MQTIKSDISYFYYSPQMLHATHNQAFSNKNQIDVLNLNTQPDTKLTPS